MVFDLTMTPCGHTWCSTTPRPSTFKLYFLDAAMAPVVQSNDCKHRWDLPTPQ